MEAAKKLVSSNPVVVFSKSVCPFCVKVKGLLNEIGASYEAYELDGDTEILAALAEWTGQRTLPNVFIGGKHIGGYDAISRLHSEGKLVPLLIEAGAVVKSTA